MNRREFLTLSVTFVGTAAVAACGGDSMMMMTGGNCISNGTKATIQDNHGHTLTIPQADLMAAATKTYTLTTALGHTHDITINASMFTSLKANNSASATTTSADAHTHLVVISCL